ncbi:MAG TPA: ThuA domain-containing protein [Paenibacillus sp.]|jgi:hypothetical protein
MNTNKKCLLLGSYTHPKFHPLQGVDTQVSHILNDVMTVQCSENKNMLLSNNIQQFDLVISYVDLWDEKISPQQTAGLLSYVSNGGGLLIIHNGISLGDRYELSQLMGAKFNGHPPYQRLSFRVSGEGHDITEGIESFDMEEEPFQYQFDTFTEKHILLEYKLGDSWHPAAWTQAYGLGRVAFLMPGHHEPSFMHPMIGQLILQAAQWTAR